jgi:methanogen homocitrate synthase
MVENYSGIKIPVNKPIVGDKVFYHESGIHVDAVIENPLTYEPFLPERIGQKREIVLGKHSGCSAVESKLKELGLEVPKDRIWDLVKKVKTTREGGEDIDDEMFIKIVDIINKQ